MTLQKKTSRLSEISETPGRTEKVSEKAKQDYLKIINPTPSTSKAVVPPPVFKMPKPISPRKSNESADDYRIDDNSDSDGENDNISISRLSTASSANRRLYSHKEETKIVQWIAKYRRYSEVNGIAMWKLMAESGELGDRTYQSLKERFRKHILRKIDTYDLSESQKEAFKQLNAKKKIRTVKNGRP